VEDQKKKVIWSKAALRELDNLLTYVEKSSLGNAEGIVDSLILHIDRALTLPGRFPKDRFRLANTGSYRAFEIKNIRVSYRVIASGIEIIEVRHVRRKGD
jgi:plasmid stabilization system protein ParE